MDWRISVVLYVVTYSLSVIIQRILVKNDKDEVISISVLFGLSTGIALLVWSLFTGNFSLNIDFGSIWYIILIMTVFYALANIVIFRALQETTAGAYSIYFSVRSIVTMVLSMILFSQSFNWIQLIGLFLILLGIVIVDYSPELWIISKGEAYSLLSALLIGSTNAMSQLLLDEMTLETFLPVMFILPPVLLIIISPKKSSNALKILKDQGILKHAAIGILYALASIFFFGSIETSGNAALITSIGLSSVIVTVLFSYFFLKEKEHFWRKVIASIVTFIGLLLLM